VLHILGNLQRDAMSRFMSRYSRIIIPIAVPIPAPTAYQTKSDGRLSVIPRSATKYGTAVTAMLISTASKNRRLEIAL